MPMTDERRDDLGRFISGPRKRARLSVRKPSAEIRQAIANAAAGTANAASESPMPGGG